MMLNKIVRELSDAEKSDFCASFQSAATDCVINRLKNAFDSLLSGGTGLGVGGITALVVAGGVAKNSMLREVLPKLAAKHGVKFAAPRLDLCTDNGAMIAWAGIENFLAGKFAPDDFAPKPRWPLNDNR
jgi:N6-L-threonylcarbamoyladenine synthase